MLRWDTGQQNCLCPAATVAEDEWKDVNWLTVEDGLFGRLATSTDVSLIDDGDDDTWHDSQQSDHDSDKHHQEPRFIDQFTPRPVYQSTTHWTDHTPTKLVQVFLLNPLTPSAHCCRIGTDAAPDRVKPSFVIFDIGAPWRSALSVRVPECQKLQMTAL